MKDLTKMISLVRRRVREHQHSDQVMQRELTEALLSIFGRHVVNKYVREAFVRNRNIVLVVSSHAMSQELFVHKEDILKRLNSKKHIADDVVIQAI